MNSNALETQQEALCNTLEARSRKVTERALCSLWAEVAKEFPECKSGDLYPDTCNDLYLTVLCAVRWWVILNFPEERGGEKHEDT